MSIKIRGVRAARQPDTRAGFFWVGPGSDSGSGCPNIRAARMYSGYPKNSGLPKKIGQPEKYRAVRKISNYRKKSGVTKSK